jgi:hypothetical protein
MYITGVHKVYTSAHPVYMGEHMLMNVYKGCIKGVYKGV